MISVFGCAEESSPGICSMCKNGILVQNGKCESMKQCLSANCKYCTLTSKGGEKCAICQDGYALMIVNNEEQKCVSEMNSTKNCLYLNGSSTCAICDVNYYFKNGYCQKSSLYFINRVELSFISLAILSLFLN